MNIWGQKIKAIREQARLSQTDLAGMLGVTVNTVWRWENGQRAPRTKHLEQIAATFSVSVDELFRVDETGEPALLTSKKLSETPKLNVAVTIEKKEPLSAVPFAEILDSVQKRAKDTSHEDRVLIAQILRRTLKELEAPEIEGKEEQKSDGAEKSA
jgi:transcriptional regulator with XRE-family HTH domain